MVTVRLPNHLERGLQLVTYYMSRDVTAALSLGCTYQLCLDSLRTYSSLELDHLSTLPL
jgi:hypothetical protein